MSLVLLTTPAQHQADNPAVEQDERRLHKWLTDLPVMNVTETVNLLQQALIPFNELQLDNHLRIRLLELYRETIDEIFYSYDDLRLKQSPISNEQRKAIKADIMWLYLELANGYKIVVRDSLEQNRSMKKSAEMLLAVYRAMEQIIHALVNAFRSYQDPPPLAYLEVNQLYLIAEQHQALDKRISSAKRENAVPTIANLFKQFLLLAVAEPFDMNEGEAFDLFFLLETQAQLCHIATELQGESLAGVYRLQLSEDMLPQPCQQSDKQTASDDCRYIDISQVLVSAREQIKVLQQTRQDLINSQELKLFRTFIEKTGPKKTGQPAANRNKTLVLSFGVAATGYFMTADNFRQHQHSSTENFGIEVRDVADEEDVEFELEKWTIVDAAKTGRMLLIPRNVTVQEIQEGMLVGMYDSISEDRLPVITLGTVRWLSPEESQERKIGVQIIPGRTLSVQCMATDGDNRDIPCLHVSAVDVLNVPPTLLLAPSDHEVGREVTLDSAGQQITIRMENAIDQTNHLVQCTYTRL